jgi:hypothetical protein
MTIRPTRRVAAAVTLAAALAAGGCGKKGAPLAPFVRIPAAVDTIDAARFGHQIYVTLTVPAMNIDMSAPVDIARVEVYGYTGTTAPPRARWAELGTLLVTIPVTPPPVVPPGASPSAADPGATDAVTDALPGAVVTILDLLEGDELVQGPVAAPAPQRPGFVPSPVVSAPSVLRRFYLAIPFSQRGRPGPPGKQVELALTVLPEPPTDLRATYDATSVALEWEPSGGLLGFLLDRALPEEVVPFDVVEPARTTPSQSSDALDAVGPASYQIYRESAPDLTRSRVDALVPSWSAMLPVAMNPAPVSATSVKEDVEFGRELCYAVRAQRGSVLSEPSPRACITPTDRFPPAPPVGLAVVPSAGAINLIWEPNAESDLGGYLVLRRGPGDATLRQLTRVPIRDARYRDDTVESGTRYTYAAVAVDTQLPQPNVSAPSAAVDEVAR